jgi:hypothetical protein
MGALLGYASQNALLLITSHIYSTRLQVPQRPNDGVGNPNGGMTVYYIRPRPPSKDLSVTIFPKGFRMRVGNPMLRNAGWALNNPSVNQTTFRCWDGTGIGPGTPGVGALDTRWFPKGPCRGGMRTQIYFPTYVRDLQYACSSRV